MKDSFGDRMKMYEKNAQERFLPLLPICARLDGVGFSKFTKGLGRPYDNGLAALMKKITSELVEFSGAKIGYTQSDEISLVWYSNNINSQIFFDGKIQKMISVLAAKATAIMNNSLPDFLPTKVGASPIFDCRVWQLPTQVEAANVFLWREKDATKNSISMAASHYYSHKQLHGKSSSEKLDLLHEKGVNWNEYPSYFKRGVFIQRTTKQTTFTLNELSDLPPLHHAHTNSNMEYDRTAIAEINMPPFTKVINRLDVIFDGAIPITNSSPH